MIIDTILLRTGNRPEMALEEKAKIIMKEAILEGEEEVKVTPPARRKKAERMKNKPKENLTQRACEDDTENLNGEHTGLNDVSSLTAAEKDGTEPCKDVLSSQVGVISSTESRETENGMLEINISAEVKGNERPLENKVENSIVEAKQFAALANETDSELSSKENEEVATAFNVLSDIKEEPSVHLESCVSPDIASGSQDDESFFSAEEAETTSESLPNLTEIVIKTATESETSQNLPLVNSENTNTDEETVSSLAQDVQEYSRTPISDSSECLNEPLPKAAEALNNSWENRNILSKNSDKESQSTEIAVFDDSVTSSSNNPVSITDKSPGAIGGETDTDSEGESSSSSNTSSEGEYDVGYFELKRGIQVSKYCHEMVFLYKAFRIDECIPQISYIVKKLGLISTPIHFR